MPNTHNPPDFDPYRPLEQSLKTGDLLNRWLLASPHKKIVGLLKGRRVLDVGCGTGNLADMLSAAGCRVVGVDSSPTMLAYARKNAPAAAFERMDAARMPFDREFDAAVISLALHEMPPPVRESVWVSMRRAVRPGGRLVALDFAVPQKDSLPARFAGGLIERDERSMLAIHPEHYRNFREFMAGGGLLAWLQKQDQPIETEYRFFGGTIAAVLCTL